MATPIYEQSALPTDKVTAAGIAGLIATTLVGIAKFFGVELDEFVVSSAVTLVMLGASYMKRETNPAQKVVIIEDTPGQHAEDRVEEN